MGIKSDGYVTTMSEPRPFKYWQTTERGRHVIVDTSPPDSASARIAWVVVGALFTCVGPALATVAWIVKPGWDAVWITALCLVLIPLGLAVVGVTDLKQRVKR